MKLAAIILDGLGPHTMRTTNLEYVESLYEDPDHAAGLMCCSSLGHTPISNQLLWSGEVDKEHVWVQKHPYQWTGGIGEFDPTWKRDEQLSDFVEVWTRQDIETNFIWDVLAHHGFDAVALGIPITLPPYSFNAEQLLTKSWFPHTPEQLRDHIRKKPRFIQYHTERGYDFIACSIKVPDQWLHAQGSEIVDREFVEAEAAVFEELFEAAIDTLEAEGYDWLVFGDHGAPAGGRTAHYPTKDLFFRHRKEAICIGTLDEVPRYTDEMYPLLLDYFGVEDVSEPLEWPENLHDGEPDLKTIMRSTAPDAAVKRASD